MMVGYLRESPQTQVNHLQLEALTEAKAEKIYRESASAEPYERPELERCIGALQAGDTLVVCRLNAIGRSVLDLAKIMKDLELRQIGFQSLSESIDTEAHGGELTFHVFAAIGSFERSLIEERTKKSVEAAQATERKLGRPTKMSTEDVRQAITLLIDHKMTKTEVAKLFNVSRVTLYKALTNDLPF